MGSIETKKETTLLREHLFTGIATLIKAGTPQEIKGETGVITNSKDRKIVGIDLRKIVFIADDKHHGTDLFYALSRKEPYKYRIIFPDEKLGLENNTVVIRNAKSLNELLAYAGFGEKLEPHELNEIRKMLLSKEQILNIKAHSELLNHSGIIDPSQVDMINEQALYLRNYKGISLPTKPDSRERVLGKYFK